MFKKEQSSILLAKWTHQPVNDIDQKSIIL